MKKQIFFTVIILSLILAGMALSAVPTETWHGLKIFADGLYVKDANTVVIDPNSGITSSKPFNNITITAPPTPATLTIASGQTLYCPTSATVSGTNTGDQDLSGYVPTSRTINGNALTSNITLYAADVGLDQVNNTSDPNKPISSLQQAALDLKVNQSSGKTATIHNSIEFYGTDSTSVTFPAGGGNVAVYDANGYIADSQVYDKHTNLDANSIGLGMAKDASYALKTAGEIYAEGVINSGSIQPITDDTYYLGKNDDDTAKAYKGLILKDTTNGKYYRIEIISGSITATDLTD